MIPITKPFLGEEEVQLARQAILSGWVTQGPCVKEFEQKFAAYVHAPYACAVSSCTAALHLALLAVGVKPGDVVLTVSHSFIATANSARYCQAEPIFVDVEKGGYNMSPDCLEYILSHECQSEEGKLWYRPITEHIHADSPLRELTRTCQKNIGRVAAILVVHQLGFPCQLDRILNIAQHFGLPVVEDAAYAVGSEILWGPENTFERIGKPHSDIACFSFHPRKMLVTGEGGMLTTRNADYDSFFRLMRHQGMGVSDLVRHQSNKVILEEYTVTGYNYRMSDLQAALGLGQLAKMPLLLKRLKDVADYYQHHLANLSWLMLPPRDPHASHNGCCFPVRLTQDAPVTQHECMQRLLDLGIATRPGVMNAHQQKPYQSRHWNLVESESAREQTMLLPAFYQITESELNCVIQALQDIR